MAELVSRGFLTRRLLRTLFRWFVQMELLAMRVMRFFVKPRFVLRGQCQRRGVCCTMIVGNPPGFVKRTPALLGVFVALHRVIYNFHVVNRGESGEVIFSCGHLQSDGRCGIYRFRPLLCRNYPILPFFEPPRPLPGCGYRVVPRVVDRMQSRLPIVDAQVAVHHPTRPGGRKAMELAEHYHGVTD
jgi:hypothetical protein